MRMSITAVFSTAIIIALLSIALLGLSGCNIVGDILVEVRSEVEGETPTTNKYTLTVISQDLPWGSGYDYRGKVVEVTGKLVNISEFLQSGRLRVGDKTVDAEFIDTPPAEWLGETITIIGSILSADDYEIDLVGCERIN